MAPSELLGLPIIAERVSGIQASTLRVPHPPKTRFLKASFFQSLRLRYSFSVVNALFFNSQHRANLFFLGWVITLFFIDTMVLKVKALKRAVPILQFFGGCY